TTVGLVQAVRSGQEADGARGAAEKDRDRAKEVTKTAYSNLYDARFQVAHQYRKEGNLCQALDLLATMEPQRLPADIGELRGFEWHFLRQQCELEVRSVPLEGEAPWWDGGQFSLDATRYARHVGGLRGGIQLWDAATGRQLSWLDDKEKNEGGMKSPILAFSGDGKRLAAGIFNGLRVWDVASQAERRTLGLDTKRFNYWSSLALSADGSRLAAFSLGVDTEWVPFLKVFDVATGREEYVLRPPELGT